MSNTLLSFFRKFLAKRDWRLAPAFCGLLAGTTVLLFSGCGQGSGDESVEEILERARVSMRIYQFRDGIDAYRQLLERVPDSSEMAQEAHFAIALAHWQKTPPSADTIQAGAKEFRFILDNAPKSSWAPAAAFNLARIEEIPDYGGDVVNTEEARRYYQLVLSEYPDSREATEAGLRYATSYLSDPDDREAIDTGLRFIEEWARDHSGDYLSEESWLILGEGRLLFNNDREGALEAFSKANREAITEYTTRKNLLWKMAVLADLLERYDEALSYYRELIRVAPRSTESTTSRLRVETLEAGGDIPPPVFSLGREPIE